MVKRWGRIFLGRILFVGSSVVPVRCIGTHILSTDFSYQLAGKISSSKKYLKYKKNVIIEQKLAIWFSLHFIIRCPVRALGAWIPCTLVSNYWSLNLIHIILSYQNKKLFTISHSVPHISTFLNWILWFKRTSIIRKYMISNNIHSNFHTLYDTYGIESMKRIVVRSVRHYHIVTVTIRAYAI